MPHEARGYEHFGGVVNELASQSTPSWPAERRASGDAPNVIVVLLDDMGFSDISPYGSEIDTPNVARLADEGYRFTNYHSSPVCSPARAALLTGLNPHRAGFATVAGDPGYPGYTMQIPDDAPTIAESFRAAGYATLMVGKWHLTRDSLMNDAADRSSWPLQRGFDRFYGSMEGLTSLFQPHRLIRDNSPLVIDEFPEDYHLTDALTDNALAMIKGVKASENGKPFFLYFAHQAVHGPLQAKPEDIEKYRGMYDDGWDHVRGERFRRQIRDGLFPEGTRCAPRNTEPGCEVVPWDSLSDEQRTLFARYMEVYAASVDNVDQNLGRLIDQLKAMGEYDNTIIAFTSDNGGTGEGGPEGTRSYFSQFTLGARLPADWVSDVERDIDLIGGPRTFVHYPQGWAYASNTPFRLYKGHTYAGGVRVPLILSWPKGMPRAEGESGLRRQYAYVSDLGQTLLELANVPRLTERHGRPAQEVDGIGFGALVRDGSLPALRTEQYTEFVGNRSLVRGNEKLVTEHLPGRPFSDDEWRLYDISIDPTELNDLAAERPERVRELAEAWRAAAWRNTVFPLGDDGSLMRQRPASELRFETAVTIFPGTPTLERFRSNKLTKLRSFEIIARLDAAVDDGVIVAHGDQGGGYVLFIENGRLCLSYNEYGRMHRVSAPLDGPAPLEGSVGAGEGAIRAAFTALPDFAVSVSVSVDGTEVLTLGPVAQLISMAPFTGISVGVDRGSPVDWELFERHRSFPMRSGLRSVEFVPGPKAPYNGELIAQIERDMERTYE